MFAADGSRKHPSANALDNSSAGQAKVVSFASILTVDQDAKSRKKKPTPRDMARRG